MSLPLDKFKRNSGFTLIETLVALTLLTVGLIPAFQEATMAVTLSGSVRNSLIASSLAQEGVEVIRALRDANWFAGRPFDDRLATGTTDCTAGCLIQYYSTDIVSLMGNPPLKLNADSGLYQYNSGDPSLFHRKMTITKIGTSELKVTSEVTWDEHSGTKQHVVEYHLFDWLQ